MKAFNEIAFRVNPIRRNHTILATKTTYLQPIPFLDFNGNCAEAMYYYEKVLGGRIKTMLSGANSPMADQVPKEYADRILNAQLELPGGAFLYAGDTQPTMPYDGIKGVSLALNFDAVEEAVAIFNAVAADGQVRMPFAPTFWATKFGMVHDKYGVTWVINAGLRDF